MWIPATVSEEHTTMGGSHQAALQYTLNAASRSLFIIRITVLANQNTTCSAEAFEYQSKRLSRLYFARYFWTYLTERSLRQLPIPPILHSVNLAILIDPNLDQAVDILLLVD